MPLSTQKGKIIQILICRGCAGEARSLLKKLRKTFQIKNILVVAVKTIHTVLILTEAQLLSCCKLNLKSSTAGVGILKGVDFSKGVIRRSLCQVAYFDKKREAKLLPLCGKNTPIA